MFSPSAWCLGVQRTFAHILLPPLFDLAFCATVCICCCCCCCCCCCRELENPPPKPAPEKAINKRLQRTQAQVNEVVDIMRVNIEKVLERDKNLSQLDDRAGAFSTDSLG
ncbi:unnamed protein product [Schistocephalus solidus]|uniref:V-SNARE coiled-coil homology domain-containing protein n=1 Tax=Schistocephalus solidus TaxID=70667 RepID=A0A3P7EQB1_SCHSO|nr:unnamed protein product [Schistocephalus solidus]